MSQNVCLFWPWHGFFQNTNSPRSHLAKHLATGTEGSGAESSTNSWHWGAAVLPRNCLRDPGTMFTPGHPQGHRMPPWLASEVRRRRKPHHTAGVETSGRYHRESTTASKRSTGSKPLVLYPSSPTSPVQTRALPGETRSRR